MPEGLDPQQRDIYKEHYSANADKGFDGGDDFHIADESLPRIEDERMEQKLSSLIEHLSSVDTELTEVRSLITQIEDTMWPGTEEGQSPYDNGPLVSERDTVELEVLEKAILNILQVGLYWKRKGMREKRYRDSIEAGKVHYSANVRAYETKAEQEANAALRARGLDPIDRGPIAS